MAFRIRSPVSTSTKEVNNIMKQKGGLVATGRQVGAYHVHTVRRSFGGQAPDDYHATVTRLNDDLKLIFIGHWKWLLKLKTGRRALDREFRRYDKRQRKLNQTEDRVI